MGLRVRLGYFPPGYTFQLSYARDVKARSCFADPRPQVAGSVTVYQSGLIFGATIHARPAPAGPRSGALKKLVSAGR